MSVNIMLYIFLLMAITACCSLIALLFNEENTFLTKLALVVSIVLCSLAIPKVLNAQFDNPTAIDVYRGKTTLVVSYKDSVAIDSIVIYK